MGGYRKDTMTLKSSKKNEKLCYQPLQHWHKSDFHVVDTISNFALQISILWKLIIKAIVAFAIDDKMLPVIKFLGLLVFSLQSHTTLHNC